MFYNTVARLNVNDDLLENKIIVSVWGNVFAYEVTNGHIIRYFCRLIDDKKRIVKKVMKVHICKILNLNR